MQSVPPNTNSHIHLPKLSLSPSAWEEYSSGLLSLIKDLVLSVWEERKVRLYGENSNVHQSRSQNDSEDLRGVAGGDGKLGCLCGKTGTSHLCDGSAHSSGCVVNGYGCLLSYHCVSIISRTSLPMSPFLTMYSLLRKSLGWIERASNFVNPISVFWNSGTCNNTTLL